MPRGEGGGKSSVAKALPLRTPGCSDRLALWRFIIPSRSPTSLALCVVQVAEVTPPLRRSNLSCARPLNSFAFLAMGPASSVLISEENMLSCDMQLEIEVYCELARRSAGGLKPTAGDVGVLLGRLWSRKLERD